MCGSLQLGSHETAIVRSGLHVKGVDAPLGAYIVFGDPAHLQGAETCFARVEKVNMMEHEWAGLKIISTTQVSIVGWEEKGRPFKKSGKATFLTVKDSRGQSRSVLVTTDAKGHRVPSLASDSSETVKD